MPKETLTITVIDKGSDFKISTSSTRGVWRFTITGRSDVVAATEIELAFAKDHHFQAELVAPAWVKAELDNRRSKA